MAEDTDCQPIVYDAVGEHDATAIIIHGLGDSAETWAVPVEDWRRNGQLDNVKFILPNAPVRSITAQGGLEMNAWFDFPRYDGTADALMNDVDSEGVAESKEYFQQLIQDEVDAGVDPERIVIGGFSQGGALSVLSGLSCEHKIAGIVCLSAWLLHADEFEDHVPEEDVNKETPVFMGHGVDDRLVPPVTGKTSYDALKGRGYDVSWEVYPDLGHATGADELEDVESWIMERLEE